LLLDVRRKLGKVKRVEETEFVSFRLAPIERDKSGVRSMFQEPTRRTRPFFFLSLAGAVAIDQGIPRIQMSENGALAVNLPIRADAYGARCARQAHAEALRQFQLLLQTVWPQGGDISVSNPFANMTKGEAAKLLGPARPLARKSVSCEYAGKQAATIYAWKRRNRKHTGAVGEGPECGLCIPCIVRRAALKAAGIKDPTSRYFFDARSVDCGSESKVVPATVPLFKFISPHVYYIQTFCARLRGMSFREFVIQYLPELRTARRDLSRFAVECQHVYELEQRFASEVTKFLGGY
jgi:7-cyano-7-deazaguanine synthase in queuosine biosynthesis